MKRIFLLRHAKSDWGDASLRDIERPLAERGERDAPAMGNWIKSQGAPEFALVSPAVRTQQTFRAINIDIPFETVDDLYPTQAGNLLRRVQQIGDDYAGILIVGHNPGISRASCTLQNELGDDPKLEDMPTCACAIIEFDCEKWEVVNFGGGRLEALMTPSRLAKLK